MRFPLLLSIAVVTAGAACTPPFTIPSESNITVPGEGILQGNPLVPEQAFPSELVNDAIVDAINQSFFTQGYDKSSVKSFQLTKLSLTVTNPDQAGGRELKDLSFLEKLTLFIAGGGSDPIKVAESAADAFAPGTLTYDMPMTGAELADVLKASEALDMTAEVDPGETPRLETEVLIATELTVVLGL